MRSFAARQEDLDPAKLLTIYNGIDVERFSHNADTAAIRAECGASSDAVLFCNVGRFTKQKGHVYLLRAMQIVAEAYPSVRLAIVGDDDPFEASTKGDILRLAHSPSLRDKVTLLGRRADVPAILLASDVFVLSSLWEGFGLVVAEAMAAGRPVIASRVDAIPEVVAGGVTGILVPPEDPARLAAAMMTLVRDRDLARCMGAAGKERAQAYFSARASAARLGQLYESLLTAKGSAEFAAGKEIPSSASGACSAGEVRRGS